MKKIMICAALFGALFSARAELECVSLDGTWDFSFARDAKLSSAASDFKVTDKMVVDGVSIRRGTYGATGSGAQHIDDDHFSGTGIVKVLRDDLAHPLIFILR